MVIHTINNLLVITINLCLLQFGYLPIRYCHLIHKFMVIYTINTLMVITINL